MKKKLLFLSSLILLGSFSYHMTGQSLSGKVTDIGGEPLAGAGDVPEAIQRLALQHHEVHALAEPGRRGAASRASALHSASDHNSGLVAGAKPSR